MKWYVAIVLYNPSIERLTDNLNAVCLLGDYSSIVLVDNGSINIDNIESIILDYSNIVLLKNGTNMGIAAALNRACSFISEQGGEWCLTLDQDSVVSKSMVDNYRELICDKTAIICPKIYDINFGPVGTQATSEFEKVSYCITSGSFCSIEVWQAVGGFDEKLFIDGVDFDYCIRIREMGYDIIRSNKVTLSHEVGQSVKVKLFGRTAKILNHSPLRLYYIARNYLYLGARYGEMRYWRGEVLKRILLVVLFEKNRIVKLKYMFKGIKHARKNIYGSYKA